MTTETKKETKNKGGRPTDYTEELASKICELIAEGHSVAKICKRDDIPSSFTIYHWLGKHKEFSERYTQALEQRTHLYAEKRHDLLQDAEDAIQNGLLSENFNQNAYIQLKREQVRAIEWDAERLSAKRYKKEIPVSVSQGDDLENLEKITAFLKENGIDVDAIK